MRIRALAAGITLTVAVAPLFTSAVAQSWGQQGVTVFQAGSGFNTGFLVDINNKGQVGGGWNNVAALFTPNAGVSTLGTLGGSFSYALGVNNSGQVVGYSGIAGDAAVHAFVTPAGGGPMQDLGTLGGLNSEAYAISNNGRVTGTSNASGSDQTHAFVMSPGGTMQDLGTLGGSYSYGQGVNDAGQVAGWSYAAGDALYRAFTTIGGVMQDLGTLGGSLSIAYDINNSGQAAGWSYTTDNAAVHAFVTSAGVMQDLGALGGDYSYAQQISDVGYIVGSAYDASNTLRAALWEASGSGYAAFSFDSIINQGANSGWTMQNASAISQDGRFVAGYASNSITGYSGLVVLEENVTPTPEPASFVLFGTGLLGVLAVVRRKRE